MEIKNRINISRNIWKLIVWIPIIVGALGFNINLRYWDTKEILIEQEQRKYNK